MTFEWPVLLVALVLVPVAIGAYAARLRRREQDADVLAVAGLVPAGGWRRSGRRHVPFVLMVAALGVMIVALARPQATLATSRASGTVLIVADVSNSMGADDVEPSRLAAAKELARRFVAAQPSSIDVGLVAFGAGALVTQQPTDDRTAVLDAIDRLKTGGGTSLGQGLLLALSTIVGAPVALADPGQPTPSPIGYFPSAAIVVLSDGEDTGGADPEAVAQLASNAGVKVSAIGVGTSEGTVIDVDGYQLATALEEQLLRDIAAVTGGTYEPAEQAAGVDAITGSIERRVTSVDEQTEITALFALVAIGMLVAAGLLMLRLFGRVV